MSARHLAPASDLMLAAEQVEELTCMKLAETAETAHPFNTGRHCVEWEVAVCALESDGCVVFIRHSCGRGVEVLGAVA